MRPDGRLVAVAYDAAGIFGFPSALALARFLPAIPVLVEEIPGDMSIEVSAIWPNPVRRTARVRISFPLTWTRFYIRDALGRERAAFVHISSGQDEEVAFDVEGLEPGVYWLTIDTPIGRTVRSFVRTRD